MGVPTGATVTAGERGRSAPVPPSSSRAAAAGSERTRTGAGSPPRPLRPPPETLPGPSPSWIGRPARPAPRPRTPLRRPDLGVPATHARAADPAGFPRPPRPRAAAPGPPSALRTPHRTRRRGCRKPVRPAQAASRLRQPIPAARGAAPAGGAFFAEVAGSPPQLGVFPPSLRLAAARCPRPKQDCLKTAASVRFKIRPPAFDRSGIRIRTLIVREAWRFCMLVLFCVARRVRGSSLHTREDRVLGISWVR